MLERGIPVILKGISVFSMGISVNWGSLVILVTRDKFVCLSWVHASNKTKMTPHDNK